MPTISDVNPITFSALLGWSFVLDRVTGGSYLGFLGIFAVGMLAIGYFASARWLKVG
jgi:hypothetical protein